MYARLAIAAGPVEQAKDARKFLAEQVAPRATDIPGLKGAYFLADETTGRFAVFSLFETEADLVASREAATKLREESTKTMGVPVQSVDEFEVIAQV
jgi:heme-degrading monooxygenase HmoA